MTVPEISDRASRIAQAAASIPAAAPAPAAPPAGSPAPIPGQAAAGGTPSVQPPPAAAPSPDTVPAAAAASVPPPPPAPDRSWEAFARREREQLAREQAFKAEREAWEAQRNQRPANVIDLEEFKKDPYGVMEKYKVPVETVVERYVNNGAPGPLEVQQQTQSETRALREQITHLQQAFERQNTQAQMQAWAAEADAIIAKDQAYGVVKKFATLDGSPASAIAFNAALMHQKETGRFLTPEEACAKVRSVLEPRWALLDGKPTQAATQQPVPTQGTTQTASQAMTQGAGVPGTREMTREERMRKAQELFSHPK